MLRILSIWILVRVRFSLRVGILKVDFTDVRAPRNIWSVSGHCVIMRMLLCWFMVPGSELEIVASKASDNPLEEFEELQEDRHVDIVEFGSKHDLIAI